MKFVKKVCDKCYTEYMRSENDYTSPPYIEIDNSDCLSIAEDYIGGMSIRKLAVKYSHAQKTILDILKKMNVPRRGPETRGRKKGEKYIKWNAISRRAKQCQIN